MNEIQLDRTYILYKIINKLIKSQSAELLKNLND